MPTETLTEFLLNAGVVGAFALYQIMVWQRADKDRKAEADRLQQEADAREKRQRDDKIMMVDAMTDVARSLAENKALIQRALDLVDERDKRP